MKKSAYGMAKKFKTKYPMTVAWRIKQNAKIVDKYMNPSEKTLYAFTCQKSNNPFDIFSSCVVTLTTERILIGRNRVVVGYFLDSITPDLFNDLKVISGVIWGKIHIDTAKELVTLSNIDKRALDEIETKITDFMMEKKKEYKS